MTSPFDAAGPRAAGDAPSATGAGDFSWDEFAGKTPLEQGKTVLAAIGAIFALGSVIRWLRR
jgi:hypothetical protein